MIESALITIFLTFVNPADPSGTTMYSSLTGDMEYDYFNNLPDSKNPNLVLPISVYDNDKNLIAPSIYETVYSKAERCLYLIESGAVKAKLPVDKVRILDKDYKIPSVKVEIIGSHKIFVIYRDGNIETNSMLDTP
jgi:hypothetical protein